jgi:hypothetical protein
MDIIPQPVIIALASMIVTLAGNHLFAGLRARQAEQRHVRERVRDDIAPLKAWLGEFVEVAGNWKLFESKAERCQEFFDEDDHFVGPCNQYPPVAQAARAVVQQCKIVAGDGTKCSVDLPEWKKAMGDAHREFLRVCDEYLADLP